MKLFEKLLFIIYVLMSGCAVGGFDVTAPLIKAPSEEEEDYNVGVDWQEYYMGHEITGKCALFYFKPIWDCPECISLDNSFKDQFTISLLNEFFISYKVTNDDIYWEKLLVKFGININNLPAVLIIKTDPHEIIGNINYGYLDSRSLNNIILNAIGDECYHD